jgi:hypothetical protein
MVIPVSLVVEDVLTEAVMRRLLAEAPNEYDIFQVLGKVGSSYIRTKFSSFNQAAKGIPIIVVIDLNSTPCPPELKDELAPRGLSTNLLLLIAVREIESWLLADRESIARFLAVSPNRLPAASEALDNPKETLVKLARRSRRKAIKEDVAPAPGSTARVGPDYNGTLSRFVYERWRPDIAAEKSPSLRRAIDLLEGFVPDWPK